ncbi:aspartate-alanine antiporter [Catellatospora sp. NPDC049609]|uniref:aspartate-alanine antiporter n=1 Tax=Catellatospora sp. NPDC049609 TaxID=3155505 RepID=UPI003426171E
MLDWLAELLRGTPGLALFLCLGLGFALGRVRFWKITLGGIAGTLLVALVIGQLGVTLDPELRNVAFALFIFTLGYMAGPSFFASLNRRALRYAVFTAIQMVTLVALTCLATVLMGLDRGTAAGLLAGGTTSSSALGTAAEALGALSLPPAQIHQLQANLATAYSVVYIFSLITIVLLAGQGVPLLMRVNVRQEAARLWHELGGGDRPEGSVAALPGFVGRIYRVTAADGMTVAAAEQALGAEAAVERLRRGEDIVEYGPDTVLRTGDHVLIVGHRAALLHGERVVGPETLGHGGGRTMTLETADVVITDPRFHGWTLSRLHEEIPLHDRHGVFITGVSRMEHELPVKPNTDVSPGDTLRLTGAAADLAAHAPRLGVRVDASVKADLSFISLGVVAGLLLGQLSVPVGGVPLSLGLGGGCLFTGLFCGWLRARRPTYGQYHPAAAQMISQFGLATFVCAVGLSAGPSAVTLISRYGVLLPLVAVLVTAVPALLSMWVAWKTMKLPAPLVAGVIAGQQCSTPAVTGAQKEAGNNTPLLSYTIVYAFSAVILPLLGPVIVGLTGALP